MPRPDHVRQEARSITIQASTYKDARAALKRLLDVERR